MLEIKSKEHKEILIKILKYFDRICRENNIKYSLIGGSLIGAVRDKEIIPWDDDIDVILTQEEYKKLLKVLLNKEGRYKLLCNENNKTFYYPFAKLVDTNTILIEKNVKKIENYGVYIDIFTYNNVPNNRIKRYFYYKKFLILKKLLGISVIDVKENYLIKTIRDKMVAFIGTRRILKVYQKESNKYNKKNTQYLLSNWPAYGYKKEIQLSKNFKNFKNTKFENIDAMITCDFDEILKTTFGDYMTPPPIEKQVSNHNFVAYWKEEAEK